MKSWKTSKTVWANIITGVLTLLASPDVLNVLPAHLLVYVPLAVNLMNIGLRFITSEPIGK